MSYGIFVAILITGASLSMVLACINILTRESFSWFGVPIPFFIAWMIATWPYLKLVLEWHQ
jgi:hypothetical protein